METDENEHPSTAHLHAPLCTIDIRITQAMNFSEITLVNYSTPDVLLFSTNSMVSTRISYMPYGGEKATGVLYTVSMNGVAGDRVEVRDYQGNVVAVMKSKTFTHDTVLFPANRSGEDDSGIIGLTRGKETSWDKWLVPTEAEDGRPVHTLHTDYNQFIFRADPKHRLAMYHASDQAEPLAELTLKSSPENPTKITLYSSSLVQYRDAVLVAFLLLEQRMRVLEKRSLAPPSSYYNPFDLSTT